MKFFYSVSVLALILAGCTSPSSSSSSKPTPTPTPGPSAASQVTAVTQVTAADLASSGAGTVPTSLAQVQDMLTDYYQDDFEQDSTIGPDINNAPLPNAFTNLQDSFNNFSTTKSATYTNSLSNQNIGNFVVLNSVSANLSASATTFDGGAIASDLSNLKTLTGSGLASADVSYHNLASSAPGPLKDLRVKANFGVDAATAADATGVYGTNGTGNLTASINYKLSASLGFSLSAPDVNIGQYLGGKVIINVDSTYNSGSKTYPEPATQFVDIFNSLFANTAPITTTVSVYDDSGTLKYTHTYANYTDFTNDYPNVGLSASVASPKSSSFFANKVSLGQLLAQALSLTKKKN